MTVVPAEFEQYTQVESFQLSGGARLFLDFCDFKHLAKWVCDEKGNEKKSQIHYPIYTYRTIVAFVENASLF